jgi:hypothetical protein
MNISLNYVRNICSSEITKYFYELKFFTLRTTDTINKIEIKVGIHTYARVYIYIYIYIHVYIYIYIRQSFIISNISNHINSNNNLLHIHIGL